MALPSASSSSVGAPAVGADGFAFCNGEFLAISGQHRHRRATARELQKHFKNGTDKSQPAHWFEAQLLHYGLESSDTKGVACERIFDAVQSNSLTVPTAISKLETRLKREWNVKNREAKKAQWESITKPEPQKTVGIKRKPEDGNVAAESTASSSLNAAKKVKTETVKQANRKEQKRGHGSAENPVIIEDTVAPTTPINQTSSRRVITQGPTPNTTTTASSRSIPSSGARSTQRPLHNTPANSRRQIPSPPTQRQYYRRRFNEPDMEGFETEEDMHMCYQMAGRTPPACGFSWSHPPARLGRLGLINGRYSVDSILAGLKWPGSRTNFHLIFTLSGSIIWGRFNLGGIRGVLWIAERPQYASNRAVSFLWRGESDEHEEFDEFEREYPDENQVLTGDDNKGHIKFLGNGRIEARLYFTSMTFSGQRLDGQGTRSEVNAWEMEAEWDKYADERMFEDVEEDEYEDYADFA